MASWVADARIAALAASLAAVGCRGEQTRAHEQLAEHMKVPATHLCNAWQMEGGGCFGDCSTRGAAREGWEAVQASRRLAELPAANDPPTESLLVEIRKRSKAVVSRIGTDCPGTVAHDAAITAQLRRCAESREAAQPSIAKLFAAVHELAEFADEETGVVVPDGQTGCQEL